MFYSWSIWDILIVVVGFIFLIVRKFMLLQAAWSFVPFNYSNDQSIRESNCLTKVSSVSLRSRPESVTRPLTFWLSKPCFSSLGTANDDLPN